MGDDYSLRDLMIDTIDSHMEWAIDRNEGQLLAEDLADSLLVNIQTYLKATREDDPPKTGLG